MAHVAADYYDMPADKLLFANFAGRPTSDIEMLGGYWTLATYYSSWSEDDDNNDGDLQASPQQKKLSRPSRPAPKLQRRAGGKGPSRTSTSTTIAPTDDISQGSGVTGRPGWRVSRRREQERTSGRLEAQTSPLFAPRRAGGARPGSFDTVKRKRKRKTQSCDGTATRRSIPGASMMRAKLGPRSGGEAISPRARQSRTSVVHPTRVQRRGDSRQLAALDTGVAADESKSARLAASPSSMLSTPRELYGIGDEHAYGETAANSPLLSSSSRSQAHYRNQQAERMDVADPRNIDWPGAMMPARVRRDCVATGLDASTMGPGEDDIVTFFAELGVMVEATEATLDRFWLRPSLTESRPQRRQRSRLRDFVLSPGLPGAAVVEIPAS